MIDMQLTTLLDTIAEPDISISEIGTWFNVVAVFAESNRSRDLAQKARMALVLSRRNVNVMKISKYRMEITAILKLMQTIDNGSGVGVVQ